MSDRHRSSELFARARKLIPGGVNSPVRSFAAVGGEPLFFSRGAGSRIYDVDGNGYIDCVCSWGPLVLGHAHPRVVKRIQRAVRDSTTFGACIEAEVELAEFVTSAMPGIEMLRLVSSGTEAVMSAIRLARAYTRRSDILKFEGCYHGHSDGLLVRAGSGVATLALPDSPGVPEDYAAHTLIAPYNDLDAVREIAEQRGGSLAAIIVEPVAGNMGVVAPAPGFLEGLRAVTRQIGALLIFDEVITGFRLGLGGAQGRFGVTPDLTTLGKVIGGGFPVGAYGGRREIMEMVAPCGPVYQAGTLSGNPVAVAAGLETLRILAEPGTYEYLERAGEALEVALAEAIREANAEASVNRVGSMLTLFFTPEGPGDYASAQRSDTARYAAFFRRVLDRGVYLPPSQFEAVFVSTAHTAQDIQHIADAARAALAQLR
jgi:glutamate-1-semialdehyde 2,1-aminomutase